MHTPSLGNAIVLAFCAVGVAQIPDHVATALAFTVSIALTGSTSEHVPTLPVEQLNGGLPLVTLPLPTMLKSIWTLPVKDAVQVAAWLTVTVVVAAVPLHAPLQPANVDPVTPGVADSVTAIPEG